MTPLGIFGGTFDPIHYGHIYPILDVCEQTGISEVRFIPSARPGHRPTPRTDELHRLNMVALAVADIPKFIPDDREIRRTGKSYMVPTLRQLRHENRFRSLCLILGADAFNQIHRWYWWSEVLRLANVVVINRLGSEMPNAHRFRHQLQPSKLPHEIWKRLCGVVCYVSTRPVNVSSTELRKMFASGSDVGKFVPEAVLAYIARHNLYSNLEVKTN